MYKPLYMRSIIIKGIFPLILRHFETLYMCNTTSVTTLISFEQNKLLNLSIKYLS